MVRKHRRKGGRITGAAFQAHSDVDTVVKYKETAIKERREQRTVLFIKEIRTGSQIPIDKLLLKHQSAGYLKVVYNSI